MKMRIAAAVAACLLLSSCAAVGPVYTPDMIRPPGNGMARLVLYIPHEMNGQRGISLKVNERECKIYMNGFMDVIVKPGDVTVAMGDDDEVIPAEKGKITYVKIYTNPGKKQAAEVFGLIGLVVYSAMKHGTRQNADIFFDVVEDDIAQQELEGMQKSEGCKKGPY
jgi:hypothetical protein